MNDIIGIIVFAVLLGVLVGVLISPTIKKKEVIVKVPVSKEITKCELKGGKYGLYWSEYSKNYVQTCRTLEKDIEL